MRLLISLLFSTAIVAAPVRADPMDRTVYMAEFYKTIEPRTALDMVERTPGFTLQEADNRRGYQGSLGNLLIDGRRLVGKNQTLADALQLIPASQVARIEILRGADVAGDPSGFAVIANLVRTPSSGQGIWGVGGEYANQGRMAPNGFINWSGRHHDTSYNIGGETYSLLRDLPGAYREYDGSGQLVGIARERSPRFYYEYAVNGSASRPVWSGTLSLSSKLKYSRYHEDTDRSAPSLDEMSVGGAFTPYTETTQSAELGGQFDREFGPWKATAIGLFTRLHFFSGVSSTERPGGDRFTQSLDHRSAENIVRFSLARSFGKQRFEAGYERANNNLDAALDLSFTTGGTVYPISVPDGNSEIVERRDEVYLADLWQAGPNLNAEMRLGYERPILEFTGDTEKRVAYGFVKPSLTVTRKLGANQLIFRFYRDVGQINFDDFVSAASLKDAIINGGNPDLRPQTQWRTELAGDFHFGSRTTLSVKAFHGRVSDTADRLPVFKDGQAYDAPGNIGNGRIEGVSIGLHLPLDRFIRGATFQADLMRQRARVVDPLTHQPRTISNLASSTTVVSFRQDVKDRHLAWGIDYSDVSELTLFRFNETDATRAAPKLDFYIEKNNLGLYSLKATVHTDAGRPIERDRVFYAPDRSGLITRRQTQSHSPGIWLNVALSRLF